jgi:sugar phosphate isomerase/epimerase
MTDPQGPWSRRSILQAAVMAPLAPVASSALAGPIASEIRETAFRFGLVTYLWGQDMDLPAVIEACQKSGLGGVELRTEHKHAVEPSLSASERDEVRQRFTDSGIELVGYGSNAQFHDAEPEKLKANIELTKEYIRLMHDCGGSGVKVKPNGFAKDVPRERTIEQIGRALNEVAAYGEGFGQQIRVEVHGTGTSELPVIKAIFDIADHPNVAVCWNSNAEDLLGDGLEANFRMVRSRFGQTLHVRELTLGEYPYPELFRLLKETSYEGWVLLEARTNPDDKIAALIEQKAAFDMLAG